VYGMKPAGQKQLGFVPHTVLMMKKGRVGDYKMTTIKDRGRWEGEDVEIGDFMQDYLVGIGGWQRAMVKADGSVVVVGGGG
jgi:hypothetical protein